MDTISNTRKLKNIWWIPILSGVIYLIFGIWFFKTPIESFKALTMFFGLFILAGGLIESYLSYKNRDFIYDFKSYLWGGILSTILGLFLITNPKALLVIVSFIISAGLIFKGSINLYRAYNLKQQNNTTWTKPLSTGILIILVAILLLWHPEIIGFTIAIWAALAFIILGIFRIYFGLRLKDNSNLK